MRKRMVALLTMLTVCAGVFVFCFGMTEKSKEQAV